MSDKELDTVAQVRTSDAIDQDEQPGRSHIEDRRGSQSPSGQRTKKPKRKDAGFKWKEKRRDVDNEEDRDLGLKRGYRDHYKPRERERSRSRSPKRDSDRYDSRREGNDGQDRNRNREYDSRRRDWDDRDRDGDKPRRTERKQEDRAERKKAGPDKKAPPAPVAPSIPQQEMILVTVNDRLGTKKQVPCLPSDTIKDFKTVVAMMIGRRPHEILLKRQSERPFKDFLTLQDYGISNNVQLDLEVDTGD